MYNVLVTGVGAIIGYGIIESLKMSKYQIKIYGIDIFKDAIGQYFCDEFIRGIRYDDENYIDFIKDIIVKNDIDIVFFGTEQEMDKISENIMQFDDIKVKFVLNTHKIIKDTTDKWITKQILQQNNHPYIKSFINKEFSEIEREIGKNMLVKPRRSYASKGIEKINTLEEFKYHKEKLKDNFMIQEIIGDDENEYTVAIFGLGNGEYINHIILQRKLSGEGATAKAKVIEDDQIKESVEKLVKTFQPIGPTNFQFRKHNGEFLLLEINPRISSSTSIRTKFGYNEAEMCIEFFLEGNIPAKRVVKKGNAIRYIKDHIIYEDCNN